MFAFLAKLLHAEAGVTAIEYGLIAALICVAIVAGLANLGANMDAMYLNISGALK